MADGAYVALNGLRTRLAELDRLAADLSNVATAGYKGERTSTYGSDRPTFDALLQKATDPAPGELKVNLARGEMTPTGRDLDFAIEGNGFFAIQTPSGVRYTQNGSFERRSDGTLSTTDGLPVLGQDGKPIQLADGPVSVDPDGTIRTGAAVAGQLRIVDAAPDAQVVREGAARFRIDDVTPVAAPSVRNHALERSNVSVVEALSHMTAASRSFEALQRGLVSLMTDVDGRAITELGRRA
jgi:flagellar basal-body rod protein FlgF